VLADDRGFQLGAACFFAFLIVLIIWLYEVFKPVYDVRFLDSPLRVASPAAFARRVRGAKTHDGTAMP